jgi:hypothetical protein
MRCHSAHRQWYARAEPTKYPVKLSFLLSHSHQPDKIKVNTVHGPSKKFFFDNVHPAARLVIVM